MTTYQLTVSRNALILLIAIVNALAVLLATLLPIYVTNPTVSAALVIFVDAIANALIIFLLSEEFTASK